MLVLTSYTLVRTSQSEPFLSEAGSRESGVFFARDQEWDGTGSRVNINRAAKVSEETRE